MRPWRLRCSQWLPHPPAAVFPFFADAHNLELLTPSFLRFQVLTPKPIAMHEGTLIDYRIKVHGLPMRWRTLISRWDPPHCFVDEQLRGPYTTWHHTHTFEAHEGGTRLGDVVRMQPRGGPLAPLVMSLFVKKDVERIFRFRAEAMARQFGGGPVRSELAWDRVD